MTTSEKIQAGKKLTSLQLGKLREKAEAGDVESLVLLAQYYGLGAGDNLELAEGYARQGAKQNSPEALLVLGKLQEMEDETKKAAATYRKAAKLGNTEAMVLLSHLYEEGDGVPQNQKKADEYLREAAGKGNAIGMWMLGDRYLHGLYGEQDVDKALYWGQKAAEAGNPEGWALQGDAYRFGGRETPVDWLEAKSLYEQGCTAGSLLCHYSLGTLLIYQPKPDFATALHHLEYAAGRGLSLAMLELCDCYRFGRGVERNVGKYLYWAKEAILAGYDEASLYLEDAFMMTRQEDILPLESPEGVEKLQKQNSPRAWYLLGKIAEEGYTALGLDEPEYYWQKAADAGYGPAQLLLYIESQERAAYSGRDKKAQKAAHKYLEQAAQWGEPNAMYLLALELLLEKARTKRNQGLKWMKKAADAGFPNACYDLGSAYLGDPSAYSSDLVALDIPKALPLLKQAADWYHDEALMAYGTYLQENGKTEEEREQGQTYVNEAMDLARALDPTMDPYDPMSPDELDQFMDLGEEGLNQLLEDLLNGKKPEI